MTFGAGLPPARSPAVRWFLGRVFLWTILVCACALPLFVATWPQSTPADRVAQLLGVFMWTLVMVIVAEGLRWPSREDSGHSLRGTLTQVIWNGWSSRDADRRSAMLRAGALCTAIIHAALAVFADPPWGLIVWFAPALWIATATPLTADELPEVWNFLVLTLVCGAQSAVCVWLCGRVVDAARRAWKRRSD